MGRVSVGLPGQHASLGRSRSPHSLVLTFEVLNERDSGLLRDHSQPGGNRRPRPGLGQARGHTAGPGLMSQPCSNFNLHWIAW